MSNRMSVSRPLKPLALMLISLPLASCAIHGGATSTRYIDTSCQAYRPITYSSRDTPETVAEIRAHNRVYDRLCPAEP
jgi:hypothetical protein